MKDDLKIKKSTIRLVKGDITDIEIDSFVYYAQSSLKLGSGFGTAITLRGGPSIQEELNKIGELKKTEAVVTAAGNLKAKSIVHAVGPAFQEENIEDKLRTTIANSLEKAEAKGITSIAFPPMGAGFYGVPLNTSADITLNSIAKYLSGDTKIKEVVICLLDNREYKPYQEKLAALQQA